MRGGSNARNLHDRLLYRLRDGMGNGVFDHVLCQEIGGIRPVTLDDTQDWNAHTRAAAVTLWLLSGRQLTTGEIAQMTHMTWHGAYKLMTNLSVALPVTQIEGRWQRILEDLAVS